MVMASRLCVLLGSVWRSGAIDGSALVQASVQAHEGASRFIQASKEGPVVTTADGPIKGVETGNIYIFKKIPYAETPERFEPAAPRKPWAPQTLSATAYGPGCIGSHTGVAESEDCLNLNIWAPKGGKTNLPVMVYFHGGMMQHGSGQEPLRQGDEIVQSEEHPVIFVNFDFRLGIFGWLQGDPKDGVTNNVGLLDQQLALRWIQRNIEAFGGDPNRVTLQGQSEGAGIILTHMTAPGSAGLFHRVIFHSPPADMWSRHANEERTKFIAQRMNCPLLRGSVGSLTMGCLRNLPAQKLWSGDWVSEELSRNIGSPKWITNAWGALKFSLTHSELPTYLGWHPVVDNVSIIGEPRDLIRQGKWNKCPVLITVSKNESYGVFPGDASTSAGTIMQGLNTLVEPGAIEQMVHDYNETLKATGIITPDRGSLLHQVITDKMWTCESRAMAEDINVGGGQVFMEMFWHSPKFDPVGRMTNPVCQNGATCHAAEMLYALPQGHGQGVSQQFGMEKEQEFVKKYSEEIRSFVHGDDVPWVPYDSASKTITFYDEAGPRAVPLYRDAQCRVLDRHMSPSLPAFMMRHTGES